MSITLASTRPVARGRQSRGTPAKKLCPRPDQGQLSVKVRGRPALSVRLRAGPIGVISALAGAQRSSLACSFEGTCGVALR
jgi:hypothetical protein